MISKFFISLLLAVHMLPHISKSAPRPENLQGLEATIKEFPASRENIDPKQAGNPAERINKNKKGVFTPLTIKKIKAKYFDDTDVGIGVLLILALFFPYVAVGIKYGIDIEFFKCILYTLLLYIPGVVYAIIKVLEIY